jgi:hypothetical protein
VQLKSCGFDAKEWKEAYNAVAASDAKNDCVPPAPLLSTNDSFDLKDDQPTINDVDIDDRNTTADTSDNGADQLLGATPSPGSAGSGPPKQKEGVVARARMFDPREQLQQVMHRLSLKDRLSLKAGSMPVKKPYLLKVALLLMDPNTRRFELLQLQFDSLKALVSDALNQIPVSAKEESLRSQQYSGICGKSATLVASDRLLTTFCDVNDVLVAVPTLLTAQECTRLAKPILSDDKVLSMVGLAWLLEAMFFFFCCLFVCPRLTLLGCAFCLLCSSCHVELMPRNGRSH